MDIFLDFHYIEKESISNAVTYIADTICDEIFKVVSKYKIKDFDLEYFMKNARKSMSKICQKGIKRC